MSYEPCKYYNENEKKCKYWDEKCPYFEKKETCSGWRYSPELDGFRYNAKTRKWEEIYDEEVE